MPQASRFLHFHGHPSARNHAEPAKLLNFAVTRSSHVGMSICRTSRVMQQFRPQNRNSKASSNRTRRRKHPCVKRVFRLWPPHAPSSHLHQTGSIKKKIPPSTVVLNQIWTQTIPRPSSVASATPSLFLARLDSCVCAAFRVTATRFSFLPQKTA